MPTWGLNDPQTDAYLSQPPPEGWTPPKPTIKRCASCGVGVTGGDGGIRAFGATFCSEECVDAVNQEGR